MIKAEKLIKSFRNGDTELVVLKGIDFKVKKGEFVSVIGRSGSGKSTLLYQLGLLDEPNSGRIWIDGVDTSTLSAKEKTTLRLNDLGYVFPDYALVPELTALENVLVPLLMQGLSKSRAKEQATEALLRVGLGDKLPNLPSQLSGGEQQRVSIARAIGHNPKILFADEPTANLDNETSLSVIKVFQTLHRDGQTIVMITHEAEYANLTDRIVTLFDGEITKDESASS